METINARELPLWDAAGEGHPLEGLETVAFGPLTDDATTATSCRLPVADLLAAAGMRVAELGLDEFDRLWQSKELQAGTLYMVNRSQSTLTGWSQGDAVTVRYALAANKFTDIGTGEVKVSE